MEHGRARLAPCRSFLSAMWRGLMTIPLQRHAIRDVKRANVPRCGGNNTILTLYLDSDTE
jgi:hypothetical protein